jgi:hypothetical protein
MSEQNFDVVVIGAGPGRLPRRNPRRAARAQDRLHRCLRRQGRQAGAGRHLPRVGCIPSKALLDSSRQFWNLTHMFADHGISAENPKIDVGAMIGRKDKIVKQFTGGITAAVQGATRPIRLRQCGLRPAAAGQCGEREAARWQRSRNHRQARDPRGRLGADRIAVCQVRWQAHPRQRRRARHHRRAQAPGRDRCRRDRPRTGQRLEAPRFRGHHPRSPARLPRRCRCGYRQGRGARIQEARASTSASARRFPRPR